MPTQHLVRAKRYDLLKGIVKNLDMQGLLDLLGQEIDDLQVADGYLISLCDLARENLRSLKLRFPDGFQHLESTYYGYKINLGEGDFSPNTRAFFSRRAVSFDAGSDSPYEQKIIAGWKLSEYLVLPLVDGENPECLPIGTLGLMKSSGRFEPEKIQLLNDLFSLFYVPLQAAIQTEFLQAFHDDFKSAAEEHARALQFIVEVNNLTSRRKIFDLFSSELFKRFNFECVGLFLLEGDVLKNVMVGCSDARYQSISDEWMTYLQGRSCMLDHADSGVSHSFMKNSLLMFQDIQQILHLPMSEMDQGMMRILKTPRTMVVLPVRYQHKAIGVMTLCSLSKVVEVSETDVHLLDTLSAFFGAAIVNSDNFTAREQQNAEIERLNRALQNQVVELAEQAATDRLTGLYNFRVFEREIDRKISECQRSATDEALSIVMFDIDHFKRFNDTHGHAAGNDVLAGVAKQISKLVRKMDMAFRYGGEEFVVMMSRCELEGSKVFAERVRQAVESTSFETESGLLSVTISAGCATYQKGDTHQTFFSRADQALYQAKNNGRNRVEG